MSDLQHMQLLRAFREDVEAGSRASFGRAAVAAGVDRRTAKRAWERGWGSIRPIRDIIDAEKHGARAALRREELAARLDEADRLAKEDAIEIRAAQGRNVRLLTATTTGALSALHAVGDKQQQLFHYLKNLVVMMQADDPADPKAEAARKAFGDVALAIRRLVAAARMAGDAENLILGQPTAIAIITGEIGVRPVAPVDASPEALAAEVEAATRALEEVKALEAKKDHDDGDGAGKLPN